MTTTPLIFCALDTPDLDQAKQWASEIGPVTGALKVGMEFVNAFGPAGIEAVQKSCPDAALFIDLKFHDIPNTVAGAVRAICKNFAPAYLNVHAAGGEAMMRAAKDACGTKTKLLAVTILTSLDSQAIIDIGYDRDVAAQVLKMAQLAKDSGLDGVVCSSHEIAALRVACGDRFDLMVPGIRPAGADQGDQKRIMTPDEALQLGATHLVIGRPITNAANPAQAAQNILNGFSS